MYDKTEVKLAVFLSLDILQIRREINLIGEILYEYINVLSIAYN